MKILRPRNTRAWFTAGCVGLGGTVVLILVMAFCVFHMVLNPTH